MKEKINTNEELERKLSKVSLIMGLVSLVVIIGVGYAFFSASVSNINNEKYSTQTATIALKFDDNDNGISGTLKLGESITKKFTLENTGTKEAYAKINWVDLINTYLSGSLSYTLEQSTSENGTYTSIGSGNVPTSNLSATETLKNGILVPVNTTHYYKLTITLNNFENVNQNSDINATFSSYFGLEEGSLSGTDIIQNLVAGEPTNTTNVITKTAPSGATCTNTLAYDGTVDNNLRYVGKNPCNYVSFNNELWRVIGVMNNVDDGTGNKETRIKLVRNESLGNYSWDTSSSDINRGLGINDWTQADLMQELNGDYLNTELNSNTMWYDGQNNQQTTEYDYTKGLKNEAQAQIRDAKWYLGGLSDEYSDRIGLIPKNMYTKERGTEVVIPGTTCSGTYCNDGITRATSWTGKVALMYPSDYGFATAGGDGISRNYCITSLTMFHDPNITTWVDSDCLGCYKNDWLQLQKSSNNSGWYLTSESKQATWVFKGSNSVTPSPSYINNSIYPTVYLKSDVSIIKGNGSESEPFVIG